MDLKLIKEALNYKVDDSTKEHLILKVIANDDKAIPKILEMLNNERGSKKTIINEMNVELSRAHVYIDAQDMRHSIGGADKNFVLDKIAAFYSKYKDTISHSFNRFN